MKNILTLILDIVPHGTPSSVADESLEELLDLTKTVGGIVVEKIVQKRGTPSAKTFLGKGKIEEAADFAKANNIELIIVNTDLKPHQYLHLGKLFPQKKIWDRIDLILNIFERHANSPEAKLQIKLARMEHEIPKIYARESTTLFERSGAGIGTRGAGEKGIEEEKRHIRRQIKSMEKKLELVQKKQGTQRRARKKTGMPTVALVGYTNAGKSSLMRFLTKKEGIRVDDALFVTLETKIGKLWLSNDLLCNDSEKIDLGGREHISMEEHPFSETDIGGQNFSLGTSVLIADTIGFIRDLPPRLISSFLTTLQEAREADLLLHVIDFSDPKAKEKIEVVEEILGQIGCASIPKIYVFNKLDNVSHFSQFREEKISFLFQKYFEKFSPVFLSTKTGENMEVLKKGIARFFS